MKRAVLNTAISLLFCSQATAQQNNPKCKPDQKFFVIGSIVGAGQGLCISHDPNQNASLSFQRDHQANETEGEISGTLAWRLFEPKTSGRLSFTTLLYGEANGNFDDTNGPNELRLGVYSEAFRHYVRKSRQSDLFMSYGFGAFYLTDFDWDASGFGLTAAAIPIVNSDTFGVNYVGLKGTPYLITRAEVDALWVNTGGNTSFNDDTDYVFVEAVLGLGYSLPKKLDASLTYTLGTDLLGGPDYHSTEAKVSFPLFGSDNAKLALVYLREEDRVSQNLNETTTINFEFRY